MEQEKVISLFFQVALVAFVLMIVFVIVIIYTRHKRNQDIRKQAQMEKDFREQLLQIQVEVQEDTFEQIGKELHDNVGQLLGSTRMMLGLTERSLTEPSKTLQSAGDSLGKAIAEIRSLSKILNKEWLQQFNFSENLSMEAERLSNQAHTRIRVEQNGAPIALKPNEQIILFRIVQESIQNALKHAQASEIRIQINALPDRLHVQVEDNGIGLPTAALSKNGVGLLNMQHRTRLLGGRVQWLPAQPSGTIVSIDIPLTAISATT